MTIAARFPRQSLQLRFLLLLAALLLLVGLVAPIITLEKFYIVETTFSVLSGFYGLVQEGQWFLFLLLAGFSVLLPSLKLLVLYRLLSVPWGDHGRLGRYLHWMHLYGKWSMLDVFVVAVMVVAVKLEVIANVQMRYGLYAFAASVLLTMLITASVVHLSERMAAETTNSEQ